MEGTKEKGEEVGREIRVHIVDTFCAFKITKYCHDLQSRTSCSLLFFKFIINMVSDET